MDTLIPLEYYTPVYYNVLLFFVVIVFFQSSSPLTSIENLKTKKTLGIFILLFLLIYIGFRPITFMFADMAVYAQVFESYKNGMQLVVDKDVLFEIFTQACAQVMSAHMFFFVCCALYIVPLYLFSKTVFKDYWFYGFFILVLSFSFWAYGTNGIRNGIATSLFMLAISRKNKIFVALWMIIAISIHQSIVVPAIAYLITLFYRNTKMLILGWLLAIPVSLASGGFWEAFFMSLGIVDEDRVVGYLSGSDMYLDQVVEVQTGFRWDFLIYSAIGIFAGWYFIIKKKFDDKLYNQIFSIYIIGNALWVLVIRANFSNRIAYLSWFLLGAVVIYPLLKSQMFKKQHQIIGGITFVYFMFSYILTIVLGK